MIQFYKLHHRKPVRTRNAPMPQDAYRRVRRTYLPRNIVVSTVFLPIAQRLFGETLFFETMIINNGVFTNYQTRYTTHRQALIGHWRAVDAVKQH